MQNSVGKHVVVGQALVWVLLCVVPLPVNADAQGMTFTPYLGYRFGGDFDDARSGSRLEIDESDTFGLILGWDVDRGQFELSYSRQSSELEDGSRASPDALVDIDVDNLMAAGKLILNQDSGAYLSFLLGLTEIDIDSDALDSDTRPAMGFGGGIDRRIDDRLGFRLGLRGIVTFLGTDEDDLCKSSRDCPILIDGSSLVQWELFAGLGIRF